MPRNEPPCNNKLDAWYPDKNSEIRELEKADGFDFMRRLFGEYKPYKTSLESVFDKLATIWKTNIAPVLIEQFGRGTTLYAILYSGEYSDEIILEIWDPKHIESKPSQVFKFNGDNKDFLKTRSKAEIISLTNWDKSF